MAGVNGLPDTIDFTDDGRFMSRSTNKSFDFLELAKEAAKHDLPKELADGVAERAVVIHDQDRLRRLRWEAHSDSTSGTAGG